MSRYTKRNRIFNDLPRYDSINKNRDTKVISMYATPEMHPLTEEQISSIEARSHLWKVGDKFYKLAHEHYGDPSMWWVIAWYNQTPTESHVKLGDIIYVPHPLDRIRMYYGY